MDFHEKFAFQLKQKKEMDPLQKKLRDFESRQIELACKENPSIRNVPVDCALFGMDIIRATREVICEPEGEFPSILPPKEVPSKIYFLKLLKDCPAQTLEVELAKYGLKSIDPHTLCAFNATHPDFSADYPNVTQWVNEGGSLWDVVFTHRQTDDKPLVMFGRCSKYACTGLLWWLACVPNGDILVSPSPPRTQICLR